MRIVGQVRNHISLILTVSVRCFDDAAMNLDVLSYSSVSEVRVH